MGTTARRLTRVLALGIALACTASILATSAVAAPPKPRMATLTISTANASQASVDITVTAGLTTGAPAGFSLQWMTAADYTANGGVWYASDSLALCKASFSGNANLSNYNLAPGESVTVNVGDFLFDNGASTNCAQELVCSTGYVFRAFAHADSTRARSDFTTTLSASTQSCTPVNNCTLTAGYWRVHGPIPVGLYSNEWPVTDMTVGAISYTDLELLAIMTTPAGGNGLISLAHQLIATKLNIANGADGSSVAGAIAAADALIGNLVVPPVGFSSLPGSATSSLTATFLNFNEGLIGPGHCG